MFSPKRILAFGDSLTAGSYDMCSKQHPYALKLRELIAQAGSDYEVDVKGINGQGTVKMVLRLKQLLMIGREYSHIVILAGTNDMGGISAEAIVENLHQMYAIAQNAAKVVVAVTIPPSENKNAWDFVLEKKRNVNEKIREYVAQHSDKFILVDLFDKMPFVPKDQDTKGYWADSLHFGPAGYDRFGELVFEAIKDTL